MMALLGYFGLRGSEIGVWSILYGAAALIPAVASADPSILRIEMRGQVDAPSRQLTLGDISFASSADLQLLRQALSMPVGRPPRPGETMVLDSARLEYWLRSRLGLSAEQMRWSGPDSTVLTTAVQTLSGDRVTTVAQKGLAEHLARVTTEAGLPPARIELQPLGEQRDVLVPSGGVDIVMRPLGNARPSKRMLVWVDVVSNGVLVKAVPVRFDVDVFAKAPVAEKAMVAGSVIGTEGVEWREVNVSGLTPSAFLRAKDEKARLRHAVSQGELITDRHVTPVPAVSRGDMARLVSQNGLVSVDSKVQVLQDGRVGDVVKARLANATGAVAVRVVAPGLLEFQQ
jgi:flagellar basal body P-ring formation protein FlgA